MNDELERTKRDLIDAENELDALEEELSQFERNNPDYEDSEEYGELIHEVNEAANHVSYLNAVIESLELEE